MARPRLSVLRAAVFCTGTLLLAACASGDAFLRGDTPTQAALRSSLAPSATTLASLTPPAPGSSLAFYQARDYRPVWSGGPEQEEMAWDVRVVLARAHQHGLRPEDYPVPPPSRTPETGEEAARYDLAFTEAVLRYARDVRTGRTRPTAVYYDVLLPSQGFDAADELAQAIQNRRVAHFLAELPPAHPEYRRLAAAFARYRGIAEKGGWPEISGTAEIRLGANDRRATALTARLKAEDPALAAIPRPSAAQLRQAVMAFQNRNGLVADGRAGTRTIAALNVPADVRAAQIAANMERWRWLPRQFEYRHIAVNVPDQKLTFVEGDETLLTSKVIVGRKTSRTPILRTTIQTAVVNPPWNIPGDIAARDLLPRLRQNANYLATRNMVVMNGPPNDPHGRTIEWRKIIPAEFPYAIRQLPSPTTALGALMLDSPNDFDIYLHDTPNKALYAQLEREISNGCVRVEDIFTLASLILSSDPDEGMKMLNTARRTRETQRLPLTAPVPVYFLYWTAIANEDGTVDFRPDRYGRDTPLVTALTRIDPGLLLNDTGGGPVPVEADELRSFDSAELSP